MITEETYTWVEELLDPRVTEISDKDYNRLLKDYFREDKTDWYKESTDGIRIWNKEKVKKFWKLLRKFSMILDKKEKMYYDFHQFIFPQREYNPEIEYSGGQFVRSINFWTIDKYKSFITKVDFSNAKFLGDFFIYKTSFRGNVNFENVKFYGEFSLTKDCTFYGEINFKNAIFYENTFFQNRFNNCNFYQTRFNKLANFEESRFTEITNFTNTVFKKDAYFNNCIFSSEVSFEGADFSEMTLFIDTEFNSNVDFSFAEFKGETNFYRTFFNELANFENSIFLGNKKKYFLDLRYKYDLKLSFKNTIFSKNILFRKINFSKTLFLNSDLADITLRECIWNEKSRIILYDEDEKMVESKGEYYENIISLEVLYRQLKKNFDNTKNWELSGKAYVSEMEMRKRRLWLEKKYYQWFIYKFYDVFGGYTQDFKKPIVSLIWLILVFSGMYFFIDYDVLKALQRGVKGALPYIQIDTENPFTGYWLILRNLEFLLGGTFLAFFVLALRKRFKQ